jgi:cyclic pyranopterin phosphate synthase
MRGRVNLPVLAPGTTSPAPIPAAATALVDPQARRVRYLRVSVTDRCNYRCVYCMPADAEHAFRPRAELLTFEEIVRVVTVFAGLGVRKVRLTGGEPTVRADVADLVAMLRGVAGVEQVVMTSNGHALGQAGGALATRLAAAGLTGLNISIDSVDPARFAQLTGGGDLARVLAGIDAALAAGIPVKLNAVAVDDGGAAADADLVGLCALAWGRGIPLRFIEPMPMSSAAYFRPAQARSAAAIRGALEARLGEPLAPVPAPGADAGPARYWQVGGDPRRTVGIISAITEHFCDACNRVRLTATGDLHACLGHDDAVALRDALRGGVSDDGLRGLIAAGVAGKRVGHDFTATGAGAPAKHMIVMGG